MIFNNTVIDNTYQVINEIGSGGMGVVYLAYHLRLEKYIVLKKIKNPHTNSSILRNEVDILKRLHHPYLPQVYDFIEYDGDLYTVIDYIDGYDLNYYIKNKYVFPESQLIKWLVQLAEVLCYLHSQSPRILHTDIKPANIIITTSGDVCLIDFGISLERTDVIKGFSESYSSPEQYNNFYYLKYGQGSYVSLDERTDIYSLGATFYHLILGVRPNVADENQPGLSRYNLPYSELLLSIIDKMMCRNPKKRYRDAAAVLKAVHGMKKQDSRYKVYILLRLVSSILSVLLIVFGISMIINSYRNEVASQYEAEYNQFVSLSNRGESEQAVRAGQSLLNNDKYEKYLSDPVKARILSKIAEDYSNIGNTYNAVYYCEQALKFEQSDLLYRDYIIALLNDNQKDKAQSVAERVCGAYPDSPALAVIQAKIYYEKREYENAVRVIDSASAALSKDIDNYCAAGIIKGDALLNLDRIDEAINAYSDVAAMNDSLNCERKLGTAYVRKAQKGAGTSAYREAYKCFEKIKNNYSPNTDDAINYAQVCLSLDDTSKFSECTELLTKSAERSEDCRLYILLAFLSEKSGSGKTAEYCDKAHKLYLSMPESDKALIDSDALYKISRLYKKYYGHEW